MIVAALFSEMRDDAKVARLANKRKGTRVPMVTRWAVLGSGGIARRRTIPEGIAPACNASLTATYDVKGAANDEVAEAFGAKACRSEAELLESDCDVIYVATPPFMHCEQVIRAAEAGKHVFCEKPLGRTPEEAKRMVETCRKYQVKLGVGFMMRFHAQHRAAQKLVTSGALGKPVLGRAQLCCWYATVDDAWRQDPAQGGGGSLIDFGSHCIDLLEMFLGKVSSVSCFKDSLVHIYPSEDTAVVLLEFESGAKGMIDNLFNVPDASAKNRLELYGSEGSILAEGTLAETQQGKMMAYIVEPTPEYDLQQAPMSLTGNAIAPKPVNMYRAEVEGFAEAVINDTDPPVDGRDGLWNQKVVAACYRAAATGRVVSVKDDG